MLAPIACVQPFEFLFNSEMGEEKGVGLVPFFDQMARNRQGLFRLRKPVSSDGVGIKVAFVGFRLTAQDRYLHFGVFFNNDSYVKGLDTIGSQLGFVNSGRCTLFRDSGAALFGQSFHSSFLRFGIPFRSAPNSDNDRTAKSCFSLFTFSFSLFTV